MKKKRFPLLAFASLTLAALFLMGCGSDKNLEPESDLVLKGADPPSTSAGVNPPLSHVAYFLFQIRIGDPNLSLVGSDAWTVDRVETHYVLVSDPGDHLQRLPEDETSRPKTRISPNTVNRVPVTVITDSFLQEYAQGFVGTSDTARVKVRVTFYTHRNKDGAQKVLQTGHILTIGNF
ncbi:MAG: hypothetical protein AB1347_12505 [Acidobacteriota bacterium]